VSEGELEIWQEYLRGFHEYIDKLLADERIDNEERVRILYATVSGLQAVITMVQEHPQVH
jgi:hypothetical protein